MKFLDNLFNKKPPRPKPNDQRNFYLIEVKTWGQYAENAKEVQSHHCRDNWQDAKYSTEKKTYHYGWLDSIPCEFVPEQNNKYDKNAILVVIDGLPVGYVPKTDNKNVLKFAKKYPYGVAEIHGGDRKYKDEYGDIIKETDTPIIEAKLFTE